MACNEYLRQFDRMAHGFWVYRIVSRISWQQTREAQGRVADVGTEFNESFYGRLSDNLVYDCPLYVCAEYQLLRIKRLQQTRYLPHS